MLKKSQGVMAGLILALAMVAQAPAQLHGPHAEPPETPEPVNLDIPPEEPVDPEQVERQELARHAIFNPEEFHEWLLELDPGRAERENLAAFAILNPGAFRRAYPKSPEEIRAEAVAAHAILHIPIVLPSLPHSN
jgi:hypothetical protein